METLSQPLSTPKVAPADPAWDEAFLRVESYLRAHHIESRVLLNSLAITIMAKTRSLAESRPGEEVVTLAMQVTNAEMGTWFARVFGEGDWSDERFRARGRLALLLANLPARWPEHFLTPDALPADSSEAMRTCAFQPGPELRFSHMPPTSLVDVMGDTTDPAHARASRQAILRAASCWLLLVGLLGFAWISSH